MALLPIRLFPDPVLRQRSRPVAAFDAELRQLAADEIGLRYRPRLDLDVDSVEHRNGSALPALDDVAQLEHG